ncbi:hypothetical protein MKX01_020402 [Papaver californicum]|nr:hypothetical protein MKX01_020402 [Papaver californicum]
MSTYSSVFSVGNFKWKVQIFPKGAREVYDHLSLFIFPVNLKKSVDVELSFSVTSQTNPSNTVTDGGKLKFLAKGGSGTGEGTGWPKFMPLSELHDPKKGFIVDDTCLIAVEVTCEVKEEDSKR